MPEPIEILNELNKHFLNHCKYCSLPVECGGLSHQDIDPESARYFAGPVSGYTYKLTLPRKGVEYGISIIGGISPTTRLPYLRFGAITVPHLSKVAVQDYGFTGAFDETDRVLKFLMAFLARLSPVDCIPPTAAA